MSTSSGEASSAGLPWTSDDVGFWLKAAFRALPYTPIFAPRGNTLRTVAPHVPDATFDIVAFSGTVLGDQSEERLAVLLWARAIVTEGAVGGSIAAYCAERGLSRATFDRRRKRACERIADAKNALAKEATL